jgi:hypothetical protein
MMQEFTIAARDHGEAILDEIDGGVAPRRAFPGLAGDVLGPVYGFGNVTVACAVHMPVDGLQHLASTA